MALPPPNLHIPSSNATVQISIINTTSHITNISTDHFLLPKISGYEFIDCPAFSFLIEHYSGRKLLFDLGVRKDWENFAPTLYDKIKNSSWKITVEKDVREVLESKSIDPSEISAIVWRFVPKTIGVCVLAGSQGDPITGVMYHTYIYAASLVITIGTILEIRQDFQSPQTWLLGRVSRRLLCLGTLKIQTR